MDRIEAITVFLTALDEGSLAAAAQLPAHVHAVLRALPGADNVEVRGLAVIVLGGMGSIPGAVVGGYLLGLIEMLALVALGSSARGGVAFAALFLMLVLRPQGLFGAQLRERI